MKEECGRTGCGKPALARCAKCGVAYCREHLLASDQEPGLFYCPECDHYVRSLKAGRVAQSRRAPR